MVKQSGLLLHASGNCDPQYRTRENVTENELLLLKKSSRIVPILSNLLMLLQVLSSVKSRTPHPSSRT